MSRFKIKIFFMFYLS